MQSCRTFLGIISTARGQEQRGVGQGDRKGLKGEVVNLSSFGEFKSPSLPFLFLSLSLSLFHSAYRRARHWWAVQPRALCNSSALQYFIIHQYSASLLHHTVRCGTIRYGARLETLESAKKKRKGMERNGREGNANPQRRGRVRSNHYLSHSHSSCLYRAENWGRGRGRDRGRRWDRGR